MNLVRFNHPGFTNFFDNLDKTRHELFNEAKGDVPSVNIIENDNSFEIEFAAPGVNKDEFNIKLENHVLTVSREVSDEKEEKDVNYTRREFIIGSFSRSFTLSKRVKFEDISAEYNEGILKLTLPKKEEEAKLSREIKIS